jgi:hypothetical protein
MRIVSFPDFEILGLTTKDDNSWYIWAIQMPGFEALQLGGRLWDYRKNVT